MPTRALRTAASGMYAQQVTIQVISNNIANMNTTSFKRNKAEFEDLMYQEVAANPLNSEAPGLNEKTAMKVQVGNGVQLSSTAKIFQQGDLQPTGDQFDMAIQGEGFFQLRKPDGSILYTRDGSFKLSSEGTIVSSNGYVLEPGLKLNSDSQGFEVSKTGSVSIVEAKGQSIEAGTIELVKFVNPAGLLSVGENLYQETPASGAPIIGQAGQSGYGEIHQGFMEASNVDIVEEMVAMIQSQRAYEVNSKTVKTVEEMMSMANNLKRG